MLASQWSLPSHCASTVLQERGLGTLSGRSIDSLPERSEGDGSWLNPCGNTSLIFTLGTSGLQNFMPNQFSCVFKGSARKGSNPLGVALPFLLAFNLFELDSVAGAPLQLCVRCRIWRGAPSHRNGKRMNIIQQVCQPPAGITCDHTLTKRMLYQLS